MKLDTPGKQHKDKTDCNQHYYLYHNTAMTEVSPGHFFFFFWVVFCRGKQALHFPSSFALYLHLVWQQKWQGQFTELTRCVPDWMSCLSYSKALHSVCTALDCRWEVLPPLHLLHYLRCTHFFHRISSEAVKMTIYHSHVHKPDAILMKNASWECPSRDSELAVC